MELDTPLRTNTVGAIARNRMKNDMDCSVIFTARNARRRIGKTTMAVRFARSVQPGWTAEGSAFVEVEDFLSAYKQSEPGDVLLLDETQHGADRRRPMKESNVQLRQALAKMGNRNVTALFTSPSIVLVDKDIKALVDFRINVLKRGVALPLKIYVNDISGKVGESPLWKNDRRPELIYFDDLPADDPAMVYMRQLKEDTIEGTMKRYTPEEVEDLLAEARDETEKAVKGEMLADLYESLDLTWSELGGPLGLERTVASRLAKPFRNGDGQS